MSAKGRPRTLAALRVRDVDGVGEVYHPHGGSSRHRRPRHSMPIAGVVGECHPAAADVDFNTFRGHVAVLDQPLERGTADLVVASTVGSL